MKHLLSLCLVYLCLEGSTGIQFRHFPLASGRSEGTSGNKLAVRVPAKPTGRPSRPNDLNPAKVISEYQTFPEDEPEQSGSLEEEIQKQLTAQVSRRGSQNRQPQTVEKSQAEVRAIENQRKVLGRGKQKESPKQEQIGEQRRIHPGRGRSRRPPSRKIEDSKRVKQEAQDVRRTHASAIQDNRRRQSQVVKDMRFRAEQAIKENRRIPESAIQDTRSRQSQVVKDTRFRAEQAIKENRRIPESAIQDTRRRQTQTVKDTRFRTEQATKENRRIPESAIQDTRSRQIQAIKDTRIREEQVRQNIRIRPEQVIQETRRLPEQSIQDTRTRPNKGRQINKPKPFSEIKDTIRRGQTLQKEKRPTDFNTYPSQIRKQPIAEKANKIQAVSSNVPIPQITSSSRFFEIGERLLMTPKQPTASANGAIAFESQVEEIKDRNFLSQRTSSKRRQQGTQSAYPDSRTSLETPRDSFSRKPTGKTPKLESNNDRNFNARKKFALEKAGLRGNQGEETIKSIQNQRIGSGTNVSRRQRPVQTSRQQEQSELNGVVTFHTIEMALVQARETWARDPHRSQSAKKNKSAIFDIDFSINPNEEKVGAPYIAYDPLFDQTKHQFHNSPEKKQQIVSPMRNPELKANLRTTPQFQASSIIEPVNLWPVTSLEVTLPTRNQPANIESFRKKSIHEPIKERSFAGFSPKRQKSVISHTSPRVDAPVFQPFNVQQQEDPSPEELEAMQKALTFSIDWGRK